MGVTEPLRTRAADRQPRTVRTGGTGTSPAQRAGRSGVRVREFFGLLPLGAVALLGLNDWVLKAAFHNALTGKLSDLAGCFFLPLYCSALLSALGWRSATRLWTGAGFTALLFTAIKLSPGAADVVCSALAPLARPLGFHTLRIVADPTDLIALVMVPLACRYGARRLSLLEPTT